MSETSQNSVTDSNKAKTMLAWALTERLETPTADGTLDLPGYKIIDTLGNGGMGTVYRAQHTDLGRTVALKIFTPQGKNHDLFVERLKREGKLMAELKHPNVLSIYDAAVLKDGTPYLVLEYIKGEDLQKKLMREEKLSQRTAVRIAIEVCEALSAVHKIGIIHRDIKPANVLLGQNGSVKVTDFGISKDTRSDDSHTSLTMTGTTVGTADYMSPEQTKNEELTPRSDLYSVGVLLYEMLMGVTPRGNFESLKKSGVPKKLDYIIMRCLQRDRQKRPGSADNLARSLKRILHQLNTRSHNNYLPVALCSIGALSAVALVVYLSTKNARITPAPSPQALHTKAEKRLIGTWTNLGTTKHHLEIRPKGHFIHSTLTDGKTTSISGIWDTSKHGGYYLRYHNTPVAPDTTSPPQTNKVIHLTIQKGSLMLIDSQSQVITLSKTSQ